MVEAIEQFFLETLGRELCVLLCSMLPIIELRGAIPLGAGLGLSWWQSFGLSVAGNLLPAPFLLLLWQAIMRLLRSFRWTTSVANWLEARALRSREKVENRAFWGLLIFVAIPLPGTGAWTGSLLASLTGIRFWKALLSIVLGVIAAGIIMVLVSYGTVAVFDAWF
jgi:uncharacterized membrane protein